MLQKQTKTDKREITPLVPWFNDGFVQKPTRSIFPSLNWRRGKGEVEIFSFEISNVAILDGIKREKKTSPLPDSMMVSHKHQNVPFSHQWTGRVVLIFYMKCPRLWVQVAHNGLDILVFSVASQLHQ